MENAENIAEKQIVDAPTENNIQEVKEDGCAETNKTELVIDSQVEACDKSSETIADSAKNDTSLEKNANEIPIEENAIDAGTVKLENEETNDVSLENVQSNCEKESAELQEEAKTITQEDWKKREIELLEKISMLEEQQDSVTNEGLRIQLKVKCDENAILRTKVLSLDTELKAVLKKPNEKNKDMVNKIKKQHEDLLTKAKGMMFEKTKMLKNQELQIAALHSQVSSLKEVVTLTKNLLSIRNLENTHLQERLEVMNAKLDAEKERHNLMIKKSETSTRLNAELKAEYEIQLRLFKELKLRYDEKLKALGVSDDKPGTSEQ